MNCGIDNLINASARSSLRALCASVVSCLLIGWIIMPLPQNHNSGVPNAAVDEMVKIYDRAAQEIVKSLAVAIDTPDRGEQFKRARAARLALAIENATKKFGASIRPHIEAVSKESYTLGLRQGLTQLRDIGLRDKARAASGTFTGVDERAVQLIARDIASASVTAIDNLGQQSQRFLRTISSTEISDPAVSRAIAQGLVTGDPRIAQREVRDLFRKPGDEESYRTLGNRQIEVGNATMSVRAYSNMLVRTRTREATVQGRHNRLREADVDLVIIEGRVSRYFCTAYLGLICSIDGKSRKWPALSSLPGGGPPFHPNCSKGTRPYVEGLSPPDEEETGQAALVEFRDRGQSRANLDPDEMAAARGRI